MIDKHPVAVARPLDEDDIVTAVRFARENGMLLAVRGGGHNVAGFGTCDGGLVIDLSNMKRIDVDTKSKSARAQPGLTWGEFDKATQEQGLATTGGLVSTTGIAGFTLGGGIGWLVRKYGLTVDNLLSVRMVTAAGDKVRASHTDNPDLFWGVRGGGGNFGIVTEFEFQLHDVGPMIFGGAAFYPLERAKEVMKAIVSEDRSMPDDYTPLVVLLTAPPAPFIPGPLQGTKMVALALCYTGKEEDGKRLVAPFRELKPAVDLLGPMPYVALQGMFDAAAPRGINAYWKTSYLQELDDRAIDVLVNQASKFQSPFSQLHIHHLEGAVKRAGKDAGAFPHRDSPYVLNVIGFWMEPTGAERNITWVRETWEAVRPYSTGVPYLNFLGAEGADQVRTAYGDNYPRLVELKKKYDPTNLFRVNQNIRPG
ncbi:MAG: FAD-binding oxidoreductase [Nitrososphaerota archaeon]|nr:FAD-binding oxidoreductase [Nitrososphaerota archaeon]